MATPADDDAALVELFLAEAAELLDTLDACLLDLLESGSDPDLVHRTFRTLHTLKGVASMYGFDELSATAHELENIFADVRRTGETVEKEVVEHVLARSSRMRMLLDSSGTDTSSPHDTSPDAAEDETKPTTVAASAPAPIAGAERRFAIVLHPSPNAFERGLRLDAIAAELMSLGTGTVTPKPSRTPEPAQDAEDSSCSIEWHVDLVTSLSEDRVHEALMFLAPQDYELAETSAPAEPPSRSDRRAGRDHPEKSRRSPVTPEAETIRVASHRLDELVDLVGELVTAHGALAAAASDSDNSRVTNVAEEIGRLSGELRDIALSMRMVPIRTAFGKFRRHVHDLANELGKQAEITTEGGDTELDKGILDRLSEPILHILRNSLDHGIESPETRLAAGKPSAGHISVKASQSGGRIYIAVADDGEGIDFDRVRTKIAGDKQAVPNAPITNDALVHALFEAGFSTSESVTSVSGRGVGLDVVKRTVEALHGTVSVTSVHGQGTTITLSLPLTLAIIDGLISTVGPERYAIPLSFVEECAEMHRPQAWNKHGRDLLDVHGALLPVVHLRSFFDVAGQPPDYQIAVVVRVDNRRFGIVVDGLVGSIQTVIKPLGSLVKRADGVSGTTVLGDGGVVPIVDPADLVRIADFEQAR